MIEIGSATPAYDSENETVLEFSHKPTQLVRIAAVEVRTLVELGVASTRRIGAKPHRSF